MIEKYQFYKKLASQPFINEIWLYGSRARGDNGPRSDIDLAIIAKTASKNDWLKVYDIIDEADTLLKIDCVNFNDLPESSILRKNIIKDHVVLCKKN
ncbi:MAG UNVERIFIED_CONTAM: nucleotidyltransferase domain-containing protein [Planctomycetaceae bacterium]|jgi:predicted nucleotidyltransferase